MATDYTVRLWSKGYSPLNDNDNYSIQVDQRIWERIIREELGSRVFIRIKGIDADTDWFAPMGAPVMQTDFPSSSSDEESNESKEQEYNIYVPLWMIDAGKFFGLGEPRDIEFMSEDSFPFASKITLRVVDSAFYNSDVKEELEKALTSIGVVRKQTTIQMPVQFLDGFLIDIFISNTEPADIVLCEGEEVEIEFEEPVDQLRLPTPTPQRPPTPIPEEPEIIIPPAQLEPSSAFAAFQGAGRRLDGSIVPEIQSQVAPAPPPRNVSYAAFEPTPVPSGGHTLGSDPSIAPPPWRQGLPRGMPRRRPPVGPRDTPLI